MSDTGILDGIPPEFPSDFYKSDFDQDFIDNIRATIEKDPNRALDSMGTGGAGRIDPPILTPDIGDKDSIPVVPTTLGGGFSSDPSQDFRTPGMPDSTPIDAEDLQKIYADEAERKALSEKLGRMGIGFLAPIPFESCLFSSFQFLQLQLQLYLQ